MRYLLRSCALQSVGRERFLLEDDDRTETVGTNIPITLGSENAHNTVMNRFFLKIIIIKKIILIVSILRFILSFNLSRQYTYV